jgi:hypothetical protein
MSQRASKTVALVTTRKLSAHDCFTAFGPAQIDLLITDCEDAAVLDPFRQAGIDILVAREDAHSDPIRTVSTA